MSECSGKQTRLSPAERATLLALLTQGEAADRGAWQAFWQEVLRDYRFGRRKAPAVLGAIFDEGVSLIDAANIGSEPLVARWVRRIIEVAKSRHVDLAQLMEAIVARQATRQMTPREPGRSQSLGTHEKILAAALEVFSAKGFHGATVDEIAECAGLGKGTVYRHFSSKKGLFAELIRSKVAELERTVSGAINPDAGVLEVIETYLRVYFTFFEHNRQLYKVLIQEQSDFGAEVKALYIGNILKKVPLLKRKIYQAARDGQLKQMDFHTVFYGVMGFIDGVIQKWLASNGSYSLVDEIPTVLETIFYGFVRPGSTKG